MGLYWEPTGRLGWNDGSVALNQPPLSERVTRGASIRWAVGEPSGPRSQVWSVKGHKNRDDVYVGVRDRMAKMKLSLHSGTWRLAYTSEAAAGLVAPGENRLVRRWPVTEEVAPSWRHAVTILTATSMLGPGHEDTPPSDGIIAWFPAPASGWALRFDVLLGEPDYSPLTVNDCIGEVGRIELASGKPVWVVASEVCSDEHYEAGLAQLRARAAQHADAGGLSDRARGWSWIPAPPRSRGWWRSSSLWSGSCSGAPVAPPPAPW